jgi:predicted nucleic acid-binding protein
MLSVDANLLLYSFTAVAPEHQAARQFIESLSSRRSRFWSAVTSEARHRFGLITRARRPFTALPGKPSTGHPTSTQPRQPAW